MSLPALPTAFLVPPLNLVAVSFLGALLLRRHPKAGRVLVLAGLGGLLLLALPLTSTYLLSTLEAGLPLAAPANDPPAAIVILSGDVDQTRSGLDVGPLTLERERAGAILARQTGLPVLVTGGTLDGSAQTLAQLMAQSLSRDFAVEARWLEPDAQDTRENVRFSTAILRRHDIRSVYLVTHAWHMKRALMAFARTGFAVTAAPVRMDAPAKLTLGSLVPSTKAWLVSYYALHEWLGCMGVWLGRS